VSLISLQIFKAGAHPKETLIANCPVPFMSTFHGIYSVIPKFLPFSKPHAIHFCQHTLANPVKVDDGIELLNAASQTIAEFNEGKRTYDLAFHTMELSSDHPTLYIFSIHEPIPLLFDGWQGILFLVMPGHACPDIIIV
jgi:hypothetical protein